MWAISVRPTDTLPHSNDVLTHCGLPNERLQEELGGYKQLMWGTKPKKKWRSSPASTDQSTGKVIGDGCIRTDEGGGRDKESE